MIIRAFEPEDAAAVSALIRQTMAVSNSRDYAAPRLQLLIDYFSPEKVLQLNQERHCFVAEMNNQVIGTGALEGAELCTFFIHPDYQKMGIGARLLDALEALARQQGLAIITVDASVTGEPFYTKMGYLRTGQDREGTAGKQIGMEKRLGGLTDADC